MSQTKIVPDLTKRFESWIAEQILKLSTEALIHSEILTCTACPKIAGEYILNYKGETFRYSSEKTYAFLKFVLEGST